MVPSLALAAVGFGEGLTTFPMSAALTLAHGEFLEGIVSYLRRAPQQPALAAGRGALVILTALPSRPGRPQRRLLYDTFTAGRHEWPYHTIMNVRRSAFRAAAIAIGVLVAAPAAQGDSFKLDAGHSSVIFRVTHLGLNHFYGRFNHVEGSLELDEKDLKRARVEVTVKADSVDTNSQGRDKHVRGAAALGAEQHPLITFKASAIETTGKDAFRVRGDLTFRGVTRPISARARRLGVMSDGKGGGKIGFEVTFTFKRSDFGMTGMDMVSDDVDVIAGLEWDRIVPPRLSEEE
jgi:polyisoprenoid-binding protein YceI